MASPEAVALQNNVDPPQNSSPRPLFATRPITRSREPSRPLDEVQSVTLKRCAKNNDLNFLSHTDRNSETMYEDGY